MYNWGTGRFADVHNLRIGGITRCGSSNTRNYRVLEEPEAVMNCVLFDPYGSPQEKCNWFSSCEVLFNRLAERWLAPSIASAQQ